MYIIIVYLIQSSRSLPHSTSLHTTPLHTTPLPAFVRFDSSLCGEGLSGELDGLVHISALRKERVEDVSSIVSVGDKVQIRVKSVDEESGKVSLSMVSKEDEPAPRKGGGGGGGGDKKDRGPRLDDIFAAETMGAADWSDSMGKFEQPSFTNNVIIKGQ
jgi:predicted RNA-binding protein with RPS1 domain